MESFFTQKLNFCSQEHIREFEKLYLRPSSVQRDSHLRTTQFLTHDPQPSKHKTGSVKSWGFCVFLKKQWMCGIIVGWGTLCMFFIINILLEKYLVLLSTYSKISISFLFHSLYTTDGPEHKPISKLLQTLGKCRSCSEIICLIHLYLTRLETWHGIFKSAYDWLYSAPIDVNRNFSFGCVRSRVRSMLNTFLGFIDEKNYFT